MEILNKNQFGKISASVGFIKKKSEDERNLFLAVLLPLTGKRRVSCYGSIVYEDIHSSEVVFDPLEGRQHIGLITDVIFYSIQFTRC